MPPEISGSPPSNLGRKKHHILNHFFVDFRTRHRISPERNVASTNKNAIVNLQCVPVKLTYFPWPLTNKRLRSIPSLWPTLRRLLRCNHQSCDMSSYIDSTFALLLKINLRLRGSFLRYNSMAFAWHAKRRCVSERWRLTYWRGGQRVRPPPRQQPLKNTNGLQ